MDLTSLTSPPALAGAGAIAAFVAGLSGSPHCALMCGPLACATRTLDGGERRRAARAWQLGRASAYTIVGALLGAAGHVVTAALAPVTRALPWVMAVGLLVSALELGKRLPAFTPLARIPRLMARAGEGLSPVARAAVRGAATPFLPCGLLYGALVMATATGRAFGGALVMAAFAAGAVPALAFVQANVGRLQRHPRAFAVARRAVPVVAAAVLIWRAVAAGGSGAQHCH